MIYKQIKNSIKTKVCIIGSGIGGGTLAKKLFENKIDFIIVEAGDWKGNSDNVKYEMTGLDFGVRTTTSVQIGGTSNLWHGVLSPLDEIDFKKRPWIPYSGWPISLEDLAPFYKEASVLLGVEKYDYFFIDSLNENLLTELNNLPFNRQYLKNKLFQQPLPPVNFGEIVKSICENSDSYHLIYNSPALELIMNDDKVVKLKLGNKDRSFSYLYADVFIVAAGALETPRLLLNSNIKNNNIGRFLMDHPMGNLCQIEFKIPARYPIYSDMKYSKSMKIRSGLELKNDMQEKLRLPNHNFYLRPSFVKGIDNLSEEIKLSLLAFKDGNLTFKDVLGVITHPNVVRQILIYKFSLDVKFRYADLFFVTEQLPNPNSYVGLSLKKDKWGYPISSVHWQVTKEDINMMRRWFNLVLNNFFPNENYNFTHSIKDFDWESIFTSAVHHVGTCRLGTSKYDGVVDKNLRVFDTKNLYVCDGSIFRTAGNVNNGLSISAFACRLVDYLKGQV